jgi:hypothetical protein
MCFAKPIFHVSSRQFVQHTAFSWRVPTSSHICGRYGLRLDGFVWNVMVDGSSSGICPHNGVHSGNAMQNTLPSRNGQYIKSQSLSFLYQIAVSFYTPLNWTYVCIHYKNYLPCHLTHLCPYPLSSGIPAQRLKQSQTSARRGLSYSTSWHFTKRLSIQTYTLRHETGFITNSGKCG